MSGQDQAKVENRLEALFERLRARYPQQSKGAQDPFKVLIATILSQRTRDEVTFEAATRLFEEYPTAQALSEADPDRVQELIRPVTYYRNKTEAIQRAAQHVHYLHGGEVPRDEEALLDIPWVGRKTMNCVLVYAFAEPAVAVDIHVHRISNRLGLVETETPEETEAELTPLLDQRQRLEVNELMVRFGREICRPTYPKCGDCMLRGLCPSARDREPKGLEEPEGDTMLSRIARNYQG